MIENLTEVTPDTLASEVLKYKNQGYRLVGMTCTNKTEETVDLLYHLDRDLEMHTLRMEALRDAPVPSISGVYFCAMLPENEMRDQFALVFDGLVLDFNRTLLLDEEVTLEQVPLANNLKITKK
ncbi:NADH-quinone oxidoreductase subunit C [Desulfobaculum bizertense]|uniref:Respiratory-chain NADH dehydrogenase, subunit n=1 Tax=Desulfobaculum bizertense DSM 18034 TaxID=1121442 RepID=A0A1T4WDD6_9BACT|nr:NADH-quinone oxidoreductase subunit C [Desulfobaculum bizertense]UIJ37393.1 NADH-quinone oxidoreductase subunit C [Desulfobaculum bizertense]SKA75139.1 Respiratory-chain NADH dehydrogenase, subunit [Desulfobaculum bizertense DSM 18034]